ncbi:MAG: bacteriohemerythrin [Geobacteraceae bacterium]|nr:bacteriohemerythrin [Geobacteraceae bacterium]
MPIVEWNDSFLVGVDPFDEHHKHLVDLLNRSYNELEHDAHLESCGDLLDELSDYVSYHFVREELWMMESSYPRYEQHIAEHNSYIQHLQEFQQDYKQGKAETSLEIFTFLRRWLIEHILKSDADYGRFISSQNNNPGPA